MNRVVSGAPLEARKGHASTVAAVGHDEAEHESAQVIAYLNGTQPAKLGVIKSNRQLRVLRALIQWGEVSRANVDCTGGVANGPDLMAALSRHGLTLGKKGQPGVCVYSELRPHIDRDGEECRPGTYVLTKYGRAVLARWAAENPQLLALVN